MPLRPQPRAGGAASAPPGGVYAMGVSYAALRAGAMVINKDGTSDYLSGNTFFKPTCGAGAVQYTVVSAR